MTTTTGAAMLPGYNSDTRTPRTRFPAGATDCHAHVFGPQSRYPFAPDASYIPPDALPADYAKMLRTIGCERAVLVQPSVYGTDNRAMLDALRSGIFPFRGVAVVGENIRDRELDDMHAAGVRGIRVNLASETKGLTLTDARRFAPRLRARGWHIQFHLDLAKLPEAELELAALDIDIVIDHFGRANAERGTAAPPFQALSRLLARDHCWAKLMGPYFVSRLPPAYPDVAPLARAMVQIAPQRIVWGTDWPHTGARDAMPNDGDLADLLARWVPDEAQRKGVLVDNPARLYGFS
jgi:predicted TIM-barrel fold metal-dependent hydrolase